MPDRPVKLTKRTLDKDLDKLTYVEDAAHHVTKRLVAPGIGLIFLGLAMIFAGINVLNQPGATLAIAAVALAGYMAMNIGAKDVANNVGAAVGARAITMTQALVMAAIFEILGAMIAGGPVIKTISSHIIDTDRIITSGKLAWLMMAALLAAALWINFATWLKAPVSTTHAIVGAVVGAGAAAVGPEMVNWRVMAAISAGWVVTPFLGGTIAAGILFFIKTFIIYRDDKIAAAKYWIPILIGLMAGAFTAYLVLQLAPKDTVAGFSIIAIGIVVGLAIWFAARPLVAAQSVGCENKNSSLRKLFRLPLICSAALMSFAHGANDVANAIGPLAAIIRSVGQGSSLSVVGGAAGNTAPHWVVLIGGCGISVGVLLYGPRLIRLVGEQITKLNPMRAYCVALSAALTVIVASWFGLPVSSTHIAIGSVFGVGFFREWYTSHSKRRLAYMRMKAEASSIPWGEMEEADERNPDEIHRRRLVRRSHFMTIIAAWAITVPVSAMLAATVYWAMVALFI
ncbi:inorganic phosphate transporter [Rhizobium leucaenae]|uniref:Phosphate transporter n=1 Tax=Rhizobium leucaenae TaxID=29450 RepID=A0A7W6ZTS8_9HYPH|nr:inorganic phosphate transporter [Rhizobium leucaenae]MBB4568613.1 PiT family inorganic phosphate transporter [Rhizobium leucaenae]MBB6300226.1 PiT family inorganic phosphate transporter [Rhizobium leucaenae]